MSTQPLQSSTLTLPSVPRPRTLLGRLLTALMERDLNGALAVLAAAGERRALPRRLLFGPRLDRTCRGARRSPPQPKV